jgi:cyclopropane-fatty-acyl-phospholipid synthase
MELQTPPSVDFENIQAHYDVGNAFYALFLDPTMTYSCAKFDSPRTTLEEAQRAKIDLSLSKCDLRPGHRILDVGCGWGAAAMRANEHYGARVIGLTLSRAQFDHDQRLAAGRSGVEFRLEGWETFEEKVDRIVSIGAFEHFGHAKYPAFFSKCRGILPQDGVLLLHTITVGKVNFSLDFLRFVHFIATEIFPGGEVPEPETVIATARLAGFELVHAESLRPHYARTLDCWAANLRANEAEAVRLVGEQVFTKYMKYLIGCADLFRTGECNVHQFKLHVMP